MKKILAICAAVVLAVSAYAAKYPDVTVNDLKSAIESKKVTLLDANGSESYKSGHIPGAIDFEAQKKDLEKAEAAYKKAIELKADYGEAYSGLANIYNMQRKFDEAATASAKAMELSGAGGGAAAGGGSPDALFNQGVILWNAGKIADAKKQFEATIAAKPDHAEAHYQLGMALVNEGNLAGAGAEFEKYVQLAPNGPNAATAKGILATIKK